MEKDIVPELLEKIQKEFHENFSKSDKIKALEAKVRDGTATYIEAQRYAEETGEILAQVLEKHITKEALPDGRMYYNIAQRILQPTLGENHKLITNITTEVQNTLNKKAGLGIKAIVPEFNQERIDGLVNHLDHAETFEEISRTLDEPIKQHAMSVVSDAIEANAKFQYDAGLQPKIVREAEHKCCEWCERLKGAFRYPDEVPADVYRRHDRCRCTVDYMVNKKRQDVHHGNRGKKRRYVKNEYDTYVLSKYARIKRAKEMESTEEERKKDAREKRIAAWEKKKETTRIRITENTEDITKEFVKQSRAGIGNVINGDNIGHLEETEVANWLIKEFGGTVELLKESSVDGIKMPDFLWNKKAWELKNVSTKTSVDNQIHKAIKQLFGDEVGIVLDIGNRKIDEESIVNAIIEKAERRAKVRTKVIVKDRDKLIKVIEINKNKDRQT